MKKFRAKKEVFRTWFTGVLRIRGFSDEEAADTAEWACIAASCEVETHGPRKLLHLLDDEFKRSGCCVPNVRHEVVAANCGNEIWDAKRKLGPAIAWKAQKRATQLAREHGIAIVTVTNANHFGWGGAYVLDNINDGFVAGNACQGAIPITSLIGGVDARMGSNAVCIGMETHREDCPFFLWDTGIAATSWGTVQSCRLTGRPLPPGCAVDGSGALTTNANEAVALRPAGSIGNALGLLIELAAAQAGASSPQYRSAPPDRVPEGESPTCVFWHFAVDSSLGGALETGHGRSQQENVANMVGALLGNSDARLPGQRKWEALKRCRDQGGLLFDQTSYDAFQTEARARDLALPPFEEIEVEIEPIEVASK
ncbi:MAG: Ldh family oxidoreductase [Bdellovibrionota bacterium]